MSNDGDNELRYNNDDTFCELERVGPKVYRSNKYHFEINGETFEISYSSSEFALLHEAVMTLLFDTNWPARPPKTNMTNLASYLSEQDEGELVIRMTNKKEREVWE